MLKHTCVRANIGMVTVTAAVVLCSVNAPLERQAIATQTTMVEVHLQAIATHIDSITSTDSVANSNVSAAPTPAAASASATYTSFESTDPIEGPLRQLLSAALLPVGLVIAPFWYLGAPLTLPLFTLATTGTTATTYGSVITMMGWLIAPFSLSYGLVPLVKTPITVTYTDDAAVQPAATTVSTPGIPSSSQNATLVASASTDGGEISPVAAPVTQPRRSSGRTGTGESFVGRNSPRSAAAAEQTSLVVADSGSAGRSAAAPTAVSADRAAKGTRRSAAGTRGSDSSNVGRR